MNLSFALIATLTLGCAVAAMSLRNLIIAPWLSRSRSLGWPQRF